MLVIRQAEPQDAHRIFEMIVALAEYEKEPDAVRCTARELREQLSSERPPFECLLAEVDGQTCGFALYFHNYSTWRGRKGLYLEDLFVIPEQRGEGIGKHLLCTLAHIAVKRGCARMEWSVLTWNEPAIAFYESLGAIPMKGWLTYRLSDDALQEVAAGGDRSTPGSMSPPADASRD